MSIKETKTETKPPDYMMWVGGKYYTLQTFVEEAKKMGISRRVPMVPDLKFGETRIFLVSNVDENDPCVSIRVVQHKTSIDSLKRYRTFRIEKKCVPTPKVFGYFIPTAILVPGEAFTRIAEKYSAFLVTIPEDQAPKVPQRGCGKLKYRGIYLVDGLAIDFVYRALNYNPDDRVKNIIVSGSTLNVLDPPIPVPQLVRFRGLKKVNGDAIISGRPFEEWLVRE